MKNISTIVLAPSKSVTATDTAAAVDVSDFTGMGQLALNASAMGGTTPTSAVKIQHSDTIGGTYTDSGVAFTPQTAAAAFEVLEVSLDRFKRFVKVVNTITGTTPTQAYGVTLSGMKATA